MRITSFTTMGPAILCLFCKIIPKLEKQQSQPEAHASPKSKPVTMKTMTRRKMGPVGLLGVVLLSPLFMNIYTCSPSRPSGGGTPPPGGFSVEIVDENQNAVSTPHNGGTISGNWVRDSTTAGV